MATLKDALIIIAMALGVLAGSVILLAGVLALVEGVVSKRTEQYTYSFVCKDASSGAIAFRTDTGPMTYRASRSESWVLDGKGSYLPKAGELCTLHKTLVNR